MTLQSYWNAFRSKFWMSLQQIFPFLQVPQAMIDSKALEEQHCKQCKEEQRLIDLQNQITQLRVDQQLKDFH